MKLKYPKSITYKTIKFYAKIEHRSSRRKGEFWIIMYYNKTSKVEGWIHLPDDWQDINRTIVAQDIYWNDKYDCKVSGVYPRIAA